MTRVAVGQISQTADIQTAVDSIADTAADAAAHGAHLLVLPECFLGGYRPEDLRAAPALVLAGTDDPRISPLRHTAIACHLDIIVGAAVREAGRVSNAQLWVDATGRVGVAYRKTHLWSAEREIFEPGRSLVVKEALGLRIGLGICYDAGFPEFTRSLTEAGVDVIVFSSAFARGDEEQRYWIYHPSRALESSAYVAVSNVLGSLDGREYFGGSTIWGPDGQVVEGLGDSPGIAIVDVDPVRCDQARRRTGYEATRAGLGSLTTIHLADNQLKGQ